MQVRGGTRLARRYSISLIGLESYSASRRVGQVDRIRLSDCPETPPLWQK